LRRLEIVTYELKRPGAGGEVAGARVPVYLPQSPEVAQDRLQEKTLFQRLDIPVPVCAVATRQGWSARSSASACPPF